MPVTDPQTYFLQQGILGVIIVVLGSVIWMMWRRIDQKDAEIKSLYDAVNIVQEKRIIDNKETIAGAIKSTTEMVSAVSAVQKGVDGITRVLELEKRTI